MKDVNQMISTKIKFFSPVVTYVINLTHSVSFIFASQPPKHTYKF